MTTKVKLFFSSLTALTLSSSALANTADNAERLSQGLVNVKASIDNMISSSGVGTPVEGGGNNPQGGGHVPGGVPDVNNPWLVAPNEDLLESDAMALPIMVQASSSLQNAGSLADNAKLEFLSGNTQLGNFRFAQACNSMGIARSQIARANTAALQPPTGYLAAFGPDLKATVVELNNLRSSEGCP